MPSKTEPLSPKELARYEATRHLGAELLQSIREMKAGKVKAAQIHKVILFRPQIP